MISPTPSVQIKRFMVPAQNVKKERLLNHQKHLVAASGNQTVVHLLFGKKWRRRRLLKRMLKHS